MKTKEKNIFFFYYFIQSNNDINIPKSQLLLRL